jgi:hypothetical protein
MKDHLSDADQGGEGFCEEGQVNLGALFGLSEVKREKAGDAEFIFEELLDVDGMIT